MSRLISEAAEAQEIFGDDELERYASDVARKLTPCVHEFVEAQNYGQERDNVECRKCGQFWLRFDRPKTPVICNDPGELVQLVALLNVVRHFVDHHFGSPGSSCEMKLRAALRPFAGIGRKTDA